MFFVSLLYPCFFFFNLILCRRSLPKTEHIRFMLVAPPPKRGMVSLFRNCIFAS